jgi:hypothetical protein
VVQLMRSLIGRLTDGSLRQRWPTKPGSVRYRVTVRDQATRKAMGILRELEQPACELPREWLASTTVEIRVEAADMDASGNIGEYSTWLPFYVPTPADAGRRSVRATFDAEGFPIRILVRPDVGDDVLLDEARLDGKFSLPQVDSLRYKFMRFDHTQQKWLDVGGYERLRMSAEPEVQVMPSAWREQAAARQPAPFLFTCDVEVNLRYQRIPDLKTAVDEHVFGVTPGGRGKEYGIRYLMDALEKHGMKGTFFVDVLMQFQLGEHQLRRVIDSILTRGHDVQLHLHPNPNLYYADDPALRQLGLEYARTRSLSTFKRSIELGCEIFTRCVGRPPLAFRNGSYALADEYFDVLHGLGIRFDSSLYAFKNAAVSPWLKTRSTPFQHTSGVIELPVTWVVLRSGQTTRVRQHTVHLGSDAARINQALSTLWAAAPAPVVMVTHSYTMLRDLRNLPMSEQLAWDEGLKSMTSEFVYNLTRLGDEQNRKMTMDGPNLERLGALNTRLELVASSSDVKVMTFADLANVPAAQLFVATATDPVVEVDAVEGHARVTGLRRYSRSYLQQMDQHG